MASLALRLLGDFQARLSSGHLLRISAKRAQALLACLSVCPGNSLTREKLAGMLWSDRDDEHARNSLRQAVTALRRDFAAIDLFPLTIERDRLTLDRAIVDVDVWNFERLATSNLPRDLEQAAALYRGDFLYELDLADPVFDQWTMGERERLRQLAADVLERLAA